MMLVNCRNLVGVMVFLLAVLEMPVFHSTETPCSNSEHFVAGWTLVECRYSATWELGNCGLSRVVRVDSYIPYAKGGGK